MTEAPKGSPSTVLHVPVHYATPPTTAGSVIELTTLASHVADRGEYGLRLISVNDGEQVGHRSPRVIRALRQPGLAMRAHDPKGIGWVAKIPQALAVLLLADAFMAAARVHAQDPVRLEG